MSSWARPGVKCVCVGRKRKPGEPKRVNDKGYRQMPVRGQQYEVAGAWSSIVAGEAHVFIALVGFPIDHGFHVEGFRPLVTRTQEQDLALFTHLLEGKPLEVDA